MTRATDDPFSNRTGIPAVKRLNVQIPSELYRRIKVEAAARKAQPQTRPKRDHNPGSPSS